MTPSTKPDLYNILQRRQSGTEPRPQAVYAENLVSDVWFLRYAYGQTNRQTDRQTRSSQYTIHNTHHKSYYAKEAACISLKG